MSGPDFAFTVALNTPNSTRNSNWEVVPAADRKDSFFMLNFMRCDSIGLFDYVASLQHEGGRVLWGQTEDGMKIERSKGAHASRPQIANDCCYPYITA